MSLFEYGLDEAAASVKLSKFLRDTESRFSDGITLSDFGQTFFDGLRLAVSGVDAIPVDGSERKILVLSWSAAFFDLIAPKLIPSIGWPLWLIVRPAVRSAFVSFASGAIEALLPLVREVAE